MTKIHDSEPLGPERPIHFHSCNFPSCGTDQPLGDLPSDGLEPNSETALEYFLAQSDAIKASSSRSALRRFARR